MAKWRLPKKKGSACIPKSKTRREPCSKSSSIHTTNESTTEISNENYKSFLTDWQSTEKPKSANSKRNVTSHEKQKSKRDGKNGPLVIRVSAPDSRLAEANRLPFPNVHREYQDGKKYPRYYFEMRLRNLLTKKKESIPLAAWNAKFAFMQASNFCATLKHKYKLIKIDQVNMIDWSAYKYLPEHWKKGQKQ